MNTLRHFLKVTGILTLVFSCSVGPMVPTVSARGIKIPSASQIAGELENRYHMNLGSIQDQSESFNVASQKKSVPEVSLSFSPSDPKPGGKITANALPSFFSNDIGDLYFSWYLKRKDCDRDSSPSSDIRTKCDNDDNGRIDNNDWKIEAMRTLATNGFDNTETIYAGGDDTDDDGYNARFGGDNKVNTGNNYCAIYQPTSGTIYELVKNAANFKDVCSAGLTPVCIKTSTGESVDPSDFTGSGGNAFSVSDGDVSYSSAGSPLCPSGVATCSTGELRCVSDPGSITGLESAPLSTVCSSSLSNPESDCRHLFPRTSGFSAGDADFGVAEEEFWHTDPKDPGTAQNGNKDEANVVGLGQNVFTWNYDSGDEVGVAVEGTSMIMTKHDDASAYIMWAFSKNNCPADTGSSYSQTVRGYGVSFPAVSMNLNDCLEKNLIDPTEGGQPGRMEVSVTADPENPVNNESGDLSGDMVTAYATVTNSTVGSSEQVFDWTVSIANNIQFDNSGSGRRARNVTADLKAEGLFKTTRGNGLSQISLPLNMPPVGKNGLRLSDYVDTNGVGYMRFSVNVSENFSSNVARKGRGDVIVKFQTIEDRIGAYRVNASGDPLKLSLVSGGSDNEICGDRTVCPVVKNEIVGLRLGSSGFTDYSWTVNGKPLLCTKTLSDQCSDTAATKVNFLPVFGETGGIFTVGVTAIDVVSGKKAVLSRIFQIVDPSVAIVSADAGKTWPKFLGQYKDVSGNLYNDLSLNIFQIFSGESIRLKAVFIPSFLWDGVVGKWNIDGETIIENADGEIDIPSIKGAGDIYNVSYGASVISSPEIRRALQQFWNISTFDSGESVFSKSIQVEVLEAGDGTETLGAIPGSKKFAALASYIPASILFTVKAFFSMMLILLISGFMMAIVPETIARRSRE